MSSEIYKVKSLSSLDPRWITIRQGDTTELKFKLENAEGEILASGLSGMAYIAKDGFKYFEKAISVDAKGIANLVIDRVLVPRKYDLELVLGSKYKYPSQYFSLVLDVQPSAEYSDERVIDRYGKDKLVAEVVPLVKRGAQGEPGKNADPLTVVNTYKDGQGNTVVRLSDGNTFKVDKGSQGDQGPQGPPGPVYDDSGIQKKIDGKQNKLTAGTNVVISGNTISAKDTIYDDSALQLQIKNLPKKYVANIGDGSKSEYTISHNLGTRDVIVAIYQGSDPYEEYLFEVYRTNINQVRLVANRAIKQNEFRVVVLG